MKKLGDLIVLSGPSGVGKSTLVGKLKQSLPALEFSISCTTRAPRGSEQNGVEYYFLSQEEFDAKRRNNEFIESADVFSHSYGTLKSEVIDRIRRGVQVVLDIDVQGALQIRKAALEDEILKRTATFVMIAPPDLETLKSRLSGRATDSAEQVAQRLAKAQSELQNFRHYDYLVVNDDLEKASEDLLAVFKAASLRSSTIDEELFV
ncbi:MAG: guanylate kinase [Lentisphaeria bacterium]|nr:guanylate kinase [Lentisphaeria bacterium]